MLIVQVILTLGVLAFTSAETHCDCDCNDIPACYEDINECKVGTHDCSQQCINTDGSFLCSCNAGYNLVTDGKTCKDIDECNTGNGNCSQKCSNTDGSFSCSCNAGYKLASNGKTCEDINECNTGDHNCSQQCINIDGSFSCSCYHGYRWAHDGKTCEDINECTANTHNCSQYCNNTQGNYTCSCDAGYSVGSDGHTCFDCPKKFAKDELTASCLYFQGDVNFNYDQAQKFCRELGAKLLNELVDSNKLTKIGEIALVLGVFTWVYTAKKTDYCNRAIIVPYRKKWSKKPPRPCSYTENDIICVKQH